MDTIEVQRLADDLDEFVADVFASFRSFCLVVSRIRWAADAPVARRVGAGPRVAHHPSCGFLSTRSEQAVARDRVASPGPNIPAGTASGTP